MERVVGMRAHRGRVDSHECKRVGQGSQLGQYKQQWAHANEWAGVRMDRRGITGAMMVGAGAAITAVGAAAPATAAAAVPQQQQP